VGYRTKFGSSTSNDVSAQKEYTKLDPLGPVPWMGSLHLIIGSRKFRSHPPTTLWVTHYSHIIIIIDRLHPLWPGSGGISRC